MGRRPGAPGSVQSGRSEGGGETPTEGVAVAQGRGPIALQPRLPLLAVPAGWAEGEVAGTARTARLAPVTLGKPAGEPPGPRAAAEKGCGGQPLGWTWVLGAMRAPHCGPHRSGRCRGRRECNSWGALLCSPAALRNFSHFSPPLWSFGSVSKQLVHFPTSFHFSASNYPLQPTPYCHAFQRGRGPRGGDSETGVAGGLPRPLFSRRKTRVKFPLTSERNKSQPQQSNFTR